MESDSLLARLIDVFAPRRCVFCGFVCDGDEGHICAACFEDLPWIATPVSFERPPFAYAIAMLDYRFPVNAAIRRFKFDRKLFYGPAFGEVLLRALPMLPDTVDAVLPVPLHWLREARRGFNQAREIALPVAKALGVPFVRNVRRRRRTPFQSGLGAPERARNLDGAFAVRGPLAFDHVLVIDDVVTTGATLETLGKTLRQAGARSVSALCVARAT